MLKKDKKIVHVLHKGKKLNVVGKYGMNQHKTIMMKVQLFMHPHIYIKGKPGKVK